MKKKSGPSPEELKNRAELDRLRREVRGLKKAAEAGGVAAGAAAGVAAAAADATAGGLQQQIDDLDRTKQRLSKLYFGQVEESRRRAERLRRLLESLSWLGEEPDLDARLRLLAQAVTAHLGFRRAAVRLREPGSAMLLRRAMVGENPAPGPYDAGGVSLETFESWCAAGERISQSALVGRAESPAPAEGAAPESWDWLPAMRLIVPIRSKRGELVGDLTVDEPSDRFVPQREGVELLEILAQHAAALIENLRLMRALERHAEELEETARRRQDLQALKGAFLSSLSHELHRALTGVRAHAEGVRGMRDEGLTVAQVRGFLMTVHDESRRLARLSESLLDFSRFEPDAGKGGRERFAMADLLDEVRGVLEGVAARGQVALKLQIAVDDTGIEADRDQVRQLVLHLGRHALRSTPSGGVVTWRLTGDERDLMIEVEDSGGGSTEAGLDAIFDRNGGESAHARDAAVALAICRSVVEWHGGRLFADAEPGRGTRLTAVLPRASGARAALAGDSARPAPRDAALQLALEMTADTLNARAVTLFAPDPQGRLVARASTGLELPATRTLESGEGVAGWVFRNARPASAKDAAYLCVPLEGERGPLGVLAVADPIEASSFGAADALLLVAVAERVAAAWSGTPRARRAPDVAERARLARVLAEAMDLEAEELARLAGAAVLESGHDAPRDSGEPSVPASDLDTHRLEWWDGSGYPRGAAGEQIPSLARILAVVDAWLEVRAEGGAPEAGMEVLRRRRGTQFDPAVVDAFDGVWRSEERAPEAAKAA